MAIRESKTESELSVEIKKYRSSRSLEQNNLFWAICTKIALETHGAKTRDAVEEVYCQLLEQANAQSEFLLALPETEEMLRKTFRVVRERGDRVFNGKNMKIYQYFPGSSKFDIAQMNELIETALDRCAELGIADSETEMIRNEYKS